MRLEKLHRSAPAVDFNVELAGRPPGLSPRLPSPVTPSRVSAKPGGQGRSGLKGIAVSNPDSRTEEELEETSEEQVNE